MSCQLTISSAFCYTTPHMFNFLKTKSVSDEPLYFYDSATRSKREFTSIKNDVATLYTCGPTVYDHVHIGNLSAYLLSDLVKRVLIYNDYEVKQTMNFTDFGHLSDDGDHGEDKMMKGMGREGYAITLPNMLKFATTYIDAAKEDMADMNILPPEQYTRASDYVKEQIRLVETLEQKGYAYKTSDGVYFDISKFPAYGILGNIDLEALKAGARVAVNPEKKHPADFALWKFGDLGWESKWGSGFPGWHIECTAMAFATLGKQIDIHTGGEDLQYTHHNAEIAQAECATGKPFVNYWLHKSHISINNEKLAKSAGNSIKLSDLTEQGYTALEYRYWLLQSHYRTGTNFTYEALDAAKTALTRLKKQLFEEYGGTATTVSGTYRTQFVKLVNDDLDTPKALALLWEMLKDDSLEPGEKVATAQDFDRVFGFGLSDDLSDILEDLGEIMLVDAPEDIQALVNDRQAARAVQNWDEADRLREALLVKGYQIEDGPDGPKLTKN